MRLMVGKIFGPWPMFDINFILWSRLSRSVELWQRYPQAIYETVDLSRIKHNHSKGFKFYNIFSDFLAFKCLKRECNYFHYIYCLIKFYAKLIEAAQASNGTQKIGKNLNVMKARWTNHDYALYNTKIVRVMSPGHIKWTSFNWFSPDFEVIFVIIFYEKIRTESILGQPLMVFAVPVRPIPVTFAKRIIF